MPRAVCRGRIAFGLPWLLLEERLLCRRVLIVSSGYSEKSTVRPARAPAKRDLVHGERGTGGIACELEPSLLVMLGLVS